MKGPRGAKLWSPSALSGSEVITLALRLPSAAFPGPESKNFMMVETMLRAVFTMARVLVTMLLQINWTPPGWCKIKVSIKLSKNYWNKCLCMNIYKMKEDQVNLWGQEIPVKTSSSTAAMQ